MKCIAHLRIAKYRYFVSSSTSFDRTGKRTDFGLLDSEYHGQFRIRIFLELFVTSVEIQILVRFFLIQADNLPDIEKKGLMI